MFKNAYGLEKELKTLRDKGELSPVKFGFDSWNKYDEGHWLMGSRGSFVLIGGEPHHGKTKVTNELVMQLMELYDFKVAMFNTESGKVAKVFSEFYSLYIGKGFSKLRPDLKPNNFAMTDDELDIAKAFINKRLYVFEQDRKKEKYQTIENIYKMVEETERQEDIKFDCVVIDPVYDVDDFAPKAEEVKRVLSYIDYNCEINNRVDIIVNHVSETAKIVDKEGKRIKLRALADEFYGGKNNQRKAKLQLLVERPTPNDDPQNQVLENQTNVHVLKAKPEGIARMGCYPIYYDWKSKRFYEIVDGVNQFPRGSRLQNNIVDVKSEVKPATLENAFGLEEFKNIDEDGFPF